MGGAALRALRSRRRAGVRLVGLLIVLGALGFGLSYKLVSSSSDVGLVDAREAPSRAPVSSSVPDAAPSAPLPTAGGAELFKSDFDGDADDWLSPWTFRVREPAQGVLARDPDVDEGRAKSARIDVTVVSADWHVQLRRPQIALEAGTQYTLTFVARTDAARTMRVAFQREMESYPKYFEQDLEIGTDWQGYTVSFVAPETDGAAIFNFNVAAQTGSVWIDDVVLAR